MNVNTPLPTLSSKPPFFATLKWKLILTSVLCTAAVSLFGNLFLYYRMNAMLTQKADSINALHLATLSNQINDALVNLSDLGNLCASDMQVVTALEWRGSSAAAKQALEAQNRLNAYLASSPVGKNIYQITAFNTDGRFISGNGQTYGTMQDYMLITAQSVYQRMAAQTAPNGVVMYITRSIHQYGRQHPYVVALLCPVQGLGSTAGHSFLYIEMGMELFDWMLTPYDSWSSLYLADKTDLLIFPAGQDAEHTPDVPALAAAAQKERTLKLGGREYRVTAVPLNAAGLSLYSCAELNVLDDDGAQTRMAVLTVLLSSLVLTVVLAFLLATYLSEPIRLLNARLHRIAENDFSYDPVIEQADGELGQIGRTVNEMTMSIENLLRTQQQDYEQRRRIEIQLLQSQVNPHFLYNTLDSIRWMAVIQKSPGIEKMTRCLSSLLKNIAKGTQDKITVQEELALLHDYVEIQSVRYMEAFSFDDQVPQELYRYHIIKLTLQPLVENAIFHGIEPTGEAGTITVSGREDGKDLLLYVTDDGAGIPADTLARLLTTERPRSHASLNGIGVYNVHRRLQMLYGVGYGLTIESEPGCGTCVTVRIPKEE